MGKSTICLSMIVKNEEKDIKRCLESVAPYIDYWVISDTGSTDKTKDIIQSFMDEHGIPGELHDHEWVDFSTNRNYALELSRPHADFIWFMDADDNFVPSGSDPLSNLPEEYDVFHMNYTIDDGVLFSRACIMRSDAEIEFVGVLHEVLALKNGGMLSPDQRANLVGAGHIVARASPLKRNKTKREKYLNDAAILEEDLDKNPENYRTMFYLGQSYQLAGSLIEAIDAYSLRAMFPDKGNSDEVFLSLYEISKIKISLKFPAEECIDACIRAWESCPGRVESMALAMQYLLQRGRIGYALAIGVIAAKTVNPRSNSAKLDSSVYDYKFPELYSMCLFNSGDRHGAINSLQSLLDKYDGDDTKAEAVASISKLLGSFKAKVAEDE